MSLRNNFSLRRSRREDDSAEKRLIERPSKPTLVHFQVTDDAINTSIRATQGFATQRNTWSEPAGNTLPDAHSFEVSPAQPRLVKTPWELDRSKRATGSQSRTASRPLTSTKVQELPDETLHCVLDHIKFLNVSGCRLNVKSFQNDLRALCLLTKQWSRIVRSHLYREVWVPANGHQNKVEAGFRRNVSRLRLLLRTLNESPAICDMVRYLRITAKLARELESEAGSDRPVSKTSSTRHIRDIVLKCRNLEHFSGYIPMNFDLNTEIVDALSSCLNMKSHAWHLGPRRASLPKANSRSSAPHGDLGSRHVSLGSSDFLDISANWQKLETLIIWQPSHTGSICPGLITATTQRLPSLKHLFLRCISSTDFHDGTLLMLPPLKSLRLEELHGVTDQGIEQLSYSRLAMSLERLVLSGLELTSLQSLQTLFAHLDRLKTFSLFQNTAPEMPRWFAVHSNNFSLASSSMQHLNWDVLARESTAVTILANSIAAGNFPSLRTVKVPCDNDGLIQNICRPISTKSITDRDLMMLEQWERSSNYERSLRISKIQAQLRVRREMKQPALKVVVQDDESIQHTHFFSAYLGNLASDVEYSLEPAIVGTEYAIARAQDVLSPRKTRARDNIETGEEDVWSLDILF